MSGGRRSVNPTLIPGGNFASTTASPSVLTTGSAPSVAPTTSGSPTLVLNPTGAGGGGRVRNSTSSGNSANSGNSPIPTASTVLPGSGGNVGRNSTSSVVAATAPSVQLVTTRTAKILKADKVSRKFTHADIQEVYSSFRGLQFSDSNLDFVKFVDTQIHDLIDFNFRHLPKGEWRNLPAEDFFEFLLNEYQPESSSADSSLDDRFRALDPSLFVMSYRDPKCFDGLFLEVMKLLNMSGTQLTGGKSGALCAILTDRIPRVPAESKKFYLHMKAEDFKPTQIMDWFARAEDELKLLHQAVIKVESYAVQVGTKPVHDMSKLRIPKREPREEPRHKKDHHDRKEKRKSGQDSRTCKVCGRENHSPSNCQLNVQGHKHPDGNQSDQDWSDSAMGKAWEAKGFKTLPFNETFLGAAWQPPSKGSNDKKSFVKKQKKCKEQLHSLILHDSSKDLISCEIKLPNNSNATSNILLDTGALHGNYISQEVAEKIIKNDKTKCKEKSDQFKERSQQHMSVQI